MMHFEDYYYNNTNEKMCNGNRPASLIVFILLFYTSVMYTTTLICMQKDEYSINLPKYNAFKMYASLNVLTMRISENDMFFFNTIFFIFSFYSTTVFNNFSYIWKIQIEKCVIL